jgi:hypothetical protein
MRVKRSYRSGAAIVLVCAMAGSYIPNVAMAQTADEIAVARENFKTGLELEKAGKYGEALAMFEETAKVKTTDRRVRGRGEAGRSREERAGGPQGRAGSRDEAEGEAREADGGVRGQRDAGVVDHRWPGRHGQRREGLPTRSRSARRHRDAR